MTAPAALPRPAAPEVYYPSSDGKPMGETGWHVNSTIGLFGVLKEYFAPRQDVYVASNMFLYYEEGNPKAVRCPDCMVIVGAPGNHERKSFKTWVEGGAPAVIFEFSSEDTYREDLGPKRALYARLGVSEYFLFDPIGDCLNPRFQGLRLEGGAYVAMAPEADGALSSRVLGMRMVPDGTRLRLSEIATGRALLDMDAKSEALREEARRSEVEHRRAEEERLRAERESRRAETETKRAETQGKRAEQEARRAEQEARRAEQEARRAEQEARRAEQEKRRAELLSAEVERLKALLDEKGRSE